MARKKQPLRAVWYINVPDGKGGVTSILVKDADGNIKPEHEQLIAETAKAMKIRCAKALASCRGFEIEVED